MRESWKRRINQGILDVRYLDLQENPLKDLIPFLVGKISFAVLCRITPIHSVSERNI